MPKENVNADEIADALINLCENVGICDQDTATGFHSSKKKEILKSEREHSFGQFIGEIKKRQKARQESLPAVLFEYSPEGNLRGRNVNLF